MIVGIDPGVTTAVAILDINGNVLNLHSRRDMKKSDIINHILKFGNPIIISSDVDVVPKTVENIARKFGCVLYSPDRQVSFAQKKKITRDYSEITKNHHEIDALSACMKAWKHYRPMFSKIGYILKKFNKQEIFLEIISKLIKDKSPNIESAIIATESEMIGINTLR